MTTRIESELVHSSLFHDLSKSELAEVVRVAHEREVGRDEYFFHEGDPARVLYILTQGQARLVQVTPEGSQVILKFIAAGDMFGGVAFLGEAAYPASAQAVEDSAAATWDGETIAHLMEQHPRIAMNALHHLAQRVQELQDRVRELATQRVERRFARQGLAHEAAGAEAGRRIGPERNAADRAAWLGCWMGGWVRHRQRGVQ